MPNVLESRKVALEWTLKIGGGLTIAGLTLLYLSLVLGAVGDERGLLVCRGLLVACGCLWGMCLMTLVVLTAMVQISILSTPIPIPTRTADRPVRNRS